MAERTYPGLSNMEILTLRHADYMEEINKGDPSWRGQLEIKKAKHVGGVILKKFYRSLRNHMVAGILISSN